MPKCVNNRTLFNTGQRKQWSPKHLQNTGWYTCCRYIHKFAVGRHVSFIHTMRLCTCVVCAHCRVLQPVLLPQWLPTLVPSVLLPQWLPTLVPSSPPTPLLLPAWPPPTGGHTPPLLDYPHWSALYQKPTCRAYRNVLNEADYGASVVNVEK